jgi:hypothetical protein
MIRCPQPPEGGFIEVIFKSPSGDLGADILFFFAIVFIFVSY